MQQFTSVIFRCVIIFCQLINWGRFFKGQTNVKATNYICRVISVFIFLISIPQITYGQESESKQCQFLLEADNVSPLKTLYELVRKKAGLSQSLAQIEADLAQTTALQQLSTRKISEVEKQFRDQFIALSKTQGVDRSVTELANAEVARRSQVFSDALFAKIDGNSKIDPALQAFDYLIVGAGVHGEIFARNTLLNAPNAKIVLVDQQKRLGSTFSLGDFFFRLNSPVRATQPGVRPQPGRGNLNEFTKAVFQMSDTVSEKFPIANQLSDTLALNQVISPTEVLLNQTVVEVIDSVSLDTRPDWPARYQVKMASGIELYANKVIISTGIGRDRVPNKVKKAVREYEKNEDFRVQTFTQAIRRASSSQTPFREYVGQRVAVIGNGDGARVKIEWLLRLAPQESYGFDTVQVGAVGEILWVGQSAQDCAEYINNIRVRYAGIASGIKSKRISPFSEQLKDFSENPDGSFNITLGNGEVIQADKIIFTTGYEDKTYRLLKPIVRTDQGGRKFSARRLLQSSTAAVEITANVRGVGDNIVIGKQILGGEGSKLTASPDRPQNIYFTGTAARIEPTEGELAGVSDNKVAIFINGPRTATLAKKLAKQDREELGQLPAFDPFGVLTRRLQVASGSNGSVTINQPEFGSPLFVGLSTQLSLEALLISEINRFLRLDESAKGKSIEVELNRTQPTSFSLQATLKSRDGQKTDVSGAVAELFKTNPFLVNLVISQIGGENSTARLVFKSEIKRGTLNFTNDPIEYK